MRIPLLLYALAFVVRGAFMVGFPDPAYADSSYYVEVARALASGHGLNVDFVWIFAEVGGKLPVNPVLPIPPMPTGCPWRRSSRRRSSS
ncbi:MAG: hypothetical protein WKF78_08115 [Candidatus Limnocylindrales bacterium]